LDKQEKEIKLKLEKEQKDMKDEQIKNRAIFEKKIQNLTTSI